jgi:hypothetical protein
MPVHGRYRQQHLTAESGPRHDRLRIVQQDLNGAAVRDQVGRYLAVFEDRTGC